MKKILFPVVLIIALSFYASCSKQEVSKTEESLYDTMLLKSEILNTKITEYRQTKGAIDDSFSNPAYNESDIPEWLDKYISLYTSPEDIYDWNEQAVLNLIASDSQMDDDKTEAVITALALGYLMRTQYVPIANETKVKTAEECERRYRRTCARIMALYAVAGGASVALAQPEGVIIAGTSAAMAIAEARDARRDCLEEAKG